MIIIIIIIIITITIIIIVKRLRLLPRVKTLFRDSEEAYPWCL